MSINKDFFDFIEKNSLSDPNVLRLRYSNKSFDFDLEKALVQIEGRRKNIGKLKRFLTNPYFLFPDSISAEQSSHQSVAAYHSTFVKTGEKILDMTAGLGIDSLSFAHKGAEVTSVELDANKSQTLLHNAEILKLPIKVVNSNSIKFLEETDKFYDLIFIDPSRRDSENQRMYNFHHCSPDVVKYQNLLLSKSNKVLIKASPLIDISQTFKDFSNLKSIKAVGVKGECKELLILLSSDSDKNGDASVDLSAINLDNNGNILNEFTITANINDNNSINGLQYGSLSELKEGNYILEPSAMMMKLSPWKEICGLFDAVKLDKSTNLFLTSKFPDRFPGRVTQIIKILKKQDRKTLKGLPASIVSRNHPMTPDQIRKTFQLKEGDENFIYATRVENKPVFILTKSIS